ncbi:MAG: MBL fold metallo-hydrolase [Acidobacteriota bacterium]|nr:MBL fold metallo-hydrolase [Acidobacteriota bacterium]
MIFRQVVHDDLGCASYFVGDDKAGVAAVVDPRLEIDEYLELARYLGVRITDIFETHNHADHVSGHGRLQAATGATIHVHRLVAPEFPHQPFEHGDEFELGSLRIRALHTPGHRPEHTCFLLTDLHRGAEPWAVLTGDSLFVGDVARPDLAVERTEGARGIFHSLHDQLLSLPDYIEVWPGHLGGSMCGGPGMDLKVASTIGFERHHNTMLAIDDEQEFVDASVAKLGAQPPNFRAIVALNHGPLLTDAIALARVTPEELRRRQQQGAMIVDTRSDVEFAHGHIPGSIAIPLQRGGFGTKLAWLVGEARQIVFVGAAEQDGDHAAALAESVGLSEALARGAVLAGGWAAWQAEARPVATFEQLPVEQLGELLELTPASQVLDVRDRDEYEAGHIPGSLNVPWHDIDAIPEGVDPDQRLLVICASGQRAGTAASMLQRLGARELVHVVGGGVPSWATLGGAVTQTSPVA